MATLCPTRNTYEKSRRIFPTALPPNSVARGSINLDLDATRQITGSNLSLQLHPIASTIGQ